MKRDLIGGTAALAVGGIVAVEAHRIPRNDIDAVGPGEVPFALGIVIAVCGLLIIAMSSRGEGGRREDHAPRWRLIAAVFATLFVYAYSMPFIGFPIATAAFVPAMLVLLGVRAVGTLALSSAMTAISTFVIFGKILGVDLPAGTLLGG